jgi:hypothetical protein
MQAIPGVDLYFYEKWILIHRRYTDFRAPIVAITFVGAPVGVRPVGG